MKKKIAAIQKFGFNISSKIFKFTLIGGNL